MMVSKEREQDTSKLKIEKEKNENNPEEEIKVKISSSSESSSNPSSSANTNANANPRIHAANSIKNSNLSSSISALLTQDVLNSIDLHSNVIHKQNNITPLGSNKTSTSNFNYTKNIVKDGKNYSVNRNIMSASDKKLASESIDYEPVFK